MKRVNIICEGYTEEQFVKKMLSEHLFHHGKIATPRNLKGGFNYGGLKHYILQWLNKEKDAYVTTLVDFYALRTDYPTYNENENQPPHQKIAALEAAVSQDILSAPNLHNQKFIPYFQLHEFEALLFSAPDIMFDCLSIDNRSLKSDSFEKVRNDFETPEHINNNRLTAPSKRIENIVRNYTKKTDGIIIAEEIGIDKMRRACPHFDEWLIKLEEL